MSKRFGRKRRRELAAVRAALEASQEDIRRLLSDFGEFHRVKVFEERHPRFVGMQLQFTEQQLYRALSSPDAIALHAARVVHHEVYAWAAKRRERPPTDRRAPPSTTAEPS